MNAEASFVSGLSSESYCAYVFSTLSLPNSVSGFS